jgi:hypothetical protein
VYDSLNVEVLQHPYGILRILQVSVRIAYNSNSHGSCLGRRGRQTRPKPKNRED